MICMRCGKENLTRCEAPGWSGYRCSYSGFQPAMPAASCSGQRERDGAWCKLPAGDGHAHHAFHRGVGEPEGGTESGLMCWDGHRVLAVDRFIPAGKECAPPGRLEPYRYWSPVADFDRVILRFVGDYVRAVGISEIRQYAAETQQLLRCVEIVMTCTGPGRCHGRLQWCERCGDVLDVCDGGEACEYHGEEAQKRRIAKCRTWLDSLSAPDAADVKDSE